MTARRSAYLADTDRAPPMPELRIVSERSAEEASSYAIDRVCL